MSDATWRAVVLDRGASHTLVFTSRQVNGGTVWSFKHRADWWGDYGCDDPVEAILRLALLSRWKLREILPPGVMSSDERAEDLRERCIVACEQVHSCQHAEEDVMDPGDERKGQAAIRAVGAIYCADALQTVPLTRPPNATFSRKRRAPADP